MIPWAPGQGSCHLFKTNPCTATEAENWEAKGLRMGFTDFNPAAVNWNVRATSIPSVVLTEPHTKHPT